MKKILLVLGLLLIPGIAFAGQISVDAFLTVDDVTLGNLEAFRGTVVNEINDFGGGTITNGSINADKLDDNANPVVRWNEAFNDFIFTGLLQTITSGTLVATIPSGTAYVEGVRVAKAATGNTYTASKETFVSISKTGTYTFNETTLGAADPGDYPATDSIKLYKATTDGTEVTTVRDDRVLTISLGVNEDFYIVGMDIVSADSTRTPTENTVTIDAGLLNHGTTTVAKMSQQTMQLDDTSDWHDGVVDSFAGADGWCFIGIKTTGDFKFLGENPPDVADTSGNTAGILKYWDDGSDKWRVIGALRIDTNDNIAYTCTQDGSIVNYDFGQTVTLGNSATFAEVDVTDFFPTTISTQGYFGLGTTNNLKEVFIKHMHGGGEASAIARTGTGGTPTEGNYIIPLYPGATPYAIEYKTDDGGGAALSKTLGYRTNLR